MNSGRIIVLGSANMDLVIRQSRLPVPGETIAGSEFFTAAGGKGLNQAIAARRAGAAVGFLGVVGDDQFGRELRAFLEHEDVDTAGLRTLDASTGIAQVSLLDGGENSIVVIPGANADDALTRSQQAEICRSTVLLVQLERPAPLVEEALVAAHSAGVTTVLTPAPVAPGVDLLLDLVDILIPNETEALALTGATDVMTAAQELSRRAATVVVTRGSRGALVARNGEVVMTVAPRATVAVDTTGAGDTFTGVLAAWLTAGEPFDQCLKAATVGASLTVEHYGAATSMPRREEILRALSAVDEPTR